MQETESAVDIAGATTLDIEKEAAPSSHGSETVQEKTPSAPQPAPNTGGHQPAWLTVLGTFFCMFCTFGWINAIGVFQDYYETNQLSAYSSSSIGWIASLQIFIMFFGGIFVGRLFDSHGPRLLLLVGTTLHVLGLMMVSISHTFGQILACQAIISPIGSACVFYSSISAVSTHFRAKRGLATGIATSGSSLGGTIFPIMMKKLTTSTTFGWATRACAFLILGLLIIGNLTITSNLPHSGSLKIKISDYTRHYKDKYFSVMLFGTILTFFGIFIPFDFLTDSARHYGIDADLAVYLVSILNGASVFSRVSMGFLADHWGRFNVNVVGIAVSGIITLALWIPARGVAPYVVLSIIYGLSSGSFISVTPACMAEISEMRDIGTRVGALFATGSFAVLFSIMILIGGAGVAAVRVMKVGFGWKKF
ncbi:major facilitator superfamily domain-containing protein [Limtongia smithiae]|uniref:major facilitator superfamily domain-containing protein n=1 Tax=Limtongia smithiae TaxID=1125753 RepID=UPI0034CF497C